MALRCDRNEGASLVSGKKDFLFEIGTEELPPKSLRNLGDVLGEQIANGLTKAGLGYKDYRVYSTPRRLAVLVHKLDNTQPDTMFERRGPTLTAAFDGQGSPTQAALGFAQSCGVEVDQLETLENKKGAWLVYRQQQLGRQTSELLSAIIESALAHLPVPKYMRWGMLDVAFVRPVHWLVMLFGDDVIDASMFGVRSGRETRGHRFLHHETLFIAEPDAYAPLLESEGHVMPDFDIRMEAIRAQVMELAVTVKGKAVIDEALLDEVTAMVEWPVALIGEFEKRFLDVPSEALISAMKRHQKYFHVVDSQAKLMPYFITVSNIESRDADVVRSGNERVIRPRLADAAFFWDQDRKQPLIARTDVLENVVFQNKLGSLHDKAMRVSELAIYIAGQLKGNKGWAKRAAELAKCDLMTAMVGEFPDLQGIMGRYYALHDGEPEEVARAIDEQYMPRFAGDELPATKTGQAVSIADKIDTLTGIFAIGQLPTGDKDPFGLRRAALGTLRIIIERNLPLDLVEMLNEAVKLYGGQKNIKSTDNVVDQVYGFMMERLRVYYTDAGIEHDVFEAVMSRKPTRPSDFDSRLRAVESFRKLPEAESLTAANKRIHNILRQAGGVIPEKMNSKLLNEKAEQALADHMSTLSAEVRPLLAQGDYTEALKRLASLRRPVDTFFDNVMVMADDRDIRINRLALLNNMHKLFMHVADLTCLQMRNE